MMDVAEVEMAKKIMRLHTRTQGTSPFTICTQCDVRVINGRCPSYLVAEAFLELASVFDKLQANMAEMSGIILDYFPDKDENSG